MIIRRIGFGMTSWTARFSMASLVALAACAAPSSDDEAEPTKSINSALGAAGPLQGPVNQWKWFDVPGAICGDGSQTGVGVSVGTGSELVIVLEGGGACWDEFTCNVAGTGIASNIHSGYTEANLTNARGYLERLSIFNRTAAKNPYKDATLVYVPYCTGDFHIGNAEQLWPSSQQTMHYAGRTNLEADLSQIVATFPNPSRVTLAGMSAGAVGAQLYYWRFRQAFGNRRVDLIADSAPIGYLAAGRGAWHASEAFSPACTNCASDYRAIYGHYASTYPDARFAFLSYDLDPLMLTAPFADALHFTTTEDLKFYVLRPLANTRYFTPTGLKHTMLLNHIDDTAAGVQGLGDFLTAMATDSPTWSNKTPNGVTCPSAAGNASGTAEAKYVELGGCGSVLGAPTTNELIPPDLTGRYVQFQNGSIYWHPSTGAHELHGDIRERWKAAGWELSAFGYPATDEIAAAVGSARKNVFQRGVIFKTSSGVRAVLGAIYSRYASLGAEGGSLGMPETDEYPTGFLNLDRIQRFEKGYIYWSGIGGTSYWYK